MLYAHVLNRVGKGCGARRFAMSWQRSYTKPYTIPEKYGPSIVKTDFLGQGVALFIVSQFQRAYTVEPMKWDLIQSQIINSYAQEKSQRFCVKYRAQQPYEVGGPMETQEIRIRVTPEAAMIYQAASEQERLKLDALLSLRLSEASEPSRSLKEIMREASREVQKRGLTEDILKEILDER